MSTRHKDVSKMIILAVAAVVVPALLIALGMDINARRRGTKASPPQDPSAAPLTEQTFWTYAVIE
ncbi:hypothetical protein [Couchioplanes azureus]|uniref:hypothetical protein n=2 Tax=Couchioplanes caeruleus TaxID=56438 RepID=UPI00188B9D58|nr:hypothetical protein [Couchioplanes caeruleus]